MDIKSLMSRPFDKTNYQSEFNEIAKSLIEDFCIVCGEKEYYLAEIEFYYYDKCNFCEEWNKVTYPRTEKEAGELFFHYSGVDICFKSDYKKGVFGGVLIRSLYDKRCDKFITGPTVCSNEILNSCAKSKIWPKIKDCKNVGREVCDSPIGRYGVKDDNPLCFYDKKLYEKYSDKQLFKETFDDATWDYNEEKTKKVTRYYKRFII